MDISDEDEESKEEMRKRSDKDAVLEKTCQHYDFYQDALELFGLSYKLLVETEI